MGPILESFTRSIRPATRSALGLFFASPFTRNSSTSSPTLARCSRFLVRPPSEFAPRECPTPLILLRAKGLGADDTEDYYAWGGMFSEKGYTAVEIDIEAPTSPETPAKALSAMATELAQQVRLMAIPFPPVLVSTGSSTLLSQTFISDHPASGLILINPPQTTSSVNISNAQDGQAALPEFNYEPHFPILVVAANGGSSGFKAQDVEAHRLVKDYESKGVGRGGKGVSVERVKEERSEETRIQVERWLDRCGF